MQGTVYVTHSPDQNLGTQSLVQCSSLKICMANTVAMLIEHSLCNTLISCSAHQGRINYLDDIIVQSLQKVSIDGKKDFYVYNGVV